MHSRRAHVNLFPASANAVFWLAIGGIGAAILGIPALLVLWAHTPYATGKGEMPSQPVKFDHRHHVTDAEIDCLYCHDGARRGRVAGVPDTSLCMGCHAQIWTDSPELALVRESAYEHRPLHWQRVTRMPDFVYFDHAAHTTKGVGCERCHGRVETMPQVFAAESLTMDFCLDCHREQAAPIHCSECHR